MKVYLVSAKYPCRKIREVEAKIIKPGKFVWAEYNGRRFMMGVSAFQTLASAKRAKTGHLAKILENKSLQFILPHLYNRVIAILKRGVIE
jgi:hypothetical protein